MSDTPGTYTVSTSDLSPEPIQPSDISYVHMTSCYADLERRYAALSEKYDTLYALFVRIANAIDIYEGECRERESHHHQKPFSKFISETPTTGSTDS